MAVTVYSTPACRYCTEMYRKSGQMGVPVVDVNGRVMVGFRPTDIEAALKRSF